MLVGPNRGCQGGGGHKEAGTKKMTEHSTRGGLECFTKASAKEPWQVNAGRAAAVYNATIQNVRSSEVAL